MRLSKLLWIIALCAPAWAGSGLAGSARAQGTKDPSYLGPTMGFPIRPRDEPGGTTATPNTSHTVHSGRSVCNGHTRIAAITPIARTGKCRPVIPPLGTTAFLSG